MKRRDVLKSAVAGAAVLAAPRIARAESQRVLKFIPQADLASIDPIWTTADVTRNHGFMVFDTLYGVDNKYQPHPQMAAGHTVSADAKQWDITLRDGLEIPRQHAGAGARLRRLAQPLGQARRVRRRADGGDRRDVGALRQGAALAAEGAVPAGARRAWRRSPTWPASCRSGWPRPIRSSRSRRWWAADRTASSPPSASPARRSSTRSSPATCRVRTGRPSIRQGRRR